MMKPPVATTIASVLSLVVITPVTLVSTLRAADRRGDAYLTSYNGNTSTIADREELRRRDDLRRGLAALEAGDRAWKDRDYEKAYQQYILACRLIPNASNSSHSYIRALNGLCDAGVRLAEQRIAEGRYADAGAILKNILSDQYDPHCKQALIVLKHLESPDYYNKTVTPKFRANVEQVKGYFVEAKGYFDTGRFDLAYKRCEQILNVDPYNLAARRMQEEINKKRTEYGIAGYDHTRSQLLWQLEKKWDLPVRRFNGPVVGIIQQDPTQSGLTQRLQRKLETIIIPKLELREATIREAIDFLKQKSVTLDTDPDVRSRGVNIVLKLDTPAGGGGGEVVAPPVAAGAPAIPGLDAPAPAAAPAAAPGAVGVNPAEARVTVSLSNIPLGEALRYVTSLAGLKFKVEQYAVSVVPTSTPTDVLVTKEWKVPPGFLSSTPGGGGPDIGGGLNAPPAGGAAATDPTRGASTGIARRVEAKDFLLASGVSFPPGASAIFLPSSSKLIVKNTQENLDLIDYIVQSSNEHGPVQVEIESKFVEITQTNLKELSFDTTLGAGNIPGQQSLFFSGGTSGTAPATNSADFPLNVNGNPIGTNPLSGSLRSGQIAISQNAIDALLFGVGGSSALAPALGALSGVFTDPQFQVVIRALNQQKGVDLLSAPRVTTKSGQRAVIEIIREFKYPTEFEPPQIPQTIGSQNGNNGGGIINPITGLITGNSSSNSTFPVTPTTPTAFETRNTGVTLEVEPVIGPDGFTIDLNLVPQVVEFEGFINYGSPIQTTSQNALGQTQTNVITPNVINQPIFSTRKVTTSVSVFDGQTVVLGGLIREDVQKTQDKIPFLGDIPVVGRLFRSEVEQHVKRNLVIFVSARLINPAGEPVHLEEDAEETVETLPVPDLPMPAPDLPLMQK